jgi:dienelactone hydrolase
MRRACASDSTSLSVADTIKARQASRASVGHRLGRTGARAGVRVELHVYPGAYHGFYRATSARVMRQAERDNREALLRFLHE